MPSSSLLMGRGAIKELPSPLGRHSLEKSAFMLCYIHIFDSDLSVIPLS
jgi:hypothetical protein